MDTTFKFRFVNEITGAFVLLALILLAAGIFMAGRAQGLFEKKFTLHVVFDSAEGSFGLKKGSEIKILNTTAGAVERIEPTAAGSMRADFVIKERFHGFVRADSHALVKKTLVITGDAYVEITVGDRQQALLPDGAMIACSKDTEIIEQASAMLEEIRAQTIPALHKLQLFLDELPPLAIQTQNTLRETQRLLRGLERHWLLRKYMEPLESDLLIAPPRIGPLGGGLPCVVQD